jgi:non-ribosomal peptide synthetase component F
LAAAQLPPLPVQYADYALWQQQALGSLDDGSSRLSSALGYWREALRNLPEQLELAADRARPAVLSHRGGQVAFAIGPELHGALLSVSRGAGASLFMVLQAGLAALLMRLGAGTDIALGSPIAGRAEASLEDLVGFFVNTLVLRTDVSGDPSFAELVGRVRERDLEAYRHAELPFELLVEALNPARSLSRHPLFQVMLAFEGAELGAGLGAQAQFEGLRVSPQAVVTHTSKFDLSFGLSEQRGRDGTPLGLVGVVEYAADLFEQDSARALAERYVRLLTQAACDARRPLHALSILGEDERVTLIERWNATAQPLPAAGATLPELFAAQAARTPEAVAVVCGERVLSYAALQAHANRLAHHLRSLGVGPETIVGLCAERSLDLVVGLLGILKAGAAYLPLDPDYPRER